MKKIKKIIAELLACVGLVMLVSSCSSGDGFDEVKTKYTGTVNKITKTAKKADGSDIEIEYSQSDIKLIYVESSVGHYFVLYYEDICKKTENGESNDYSDVILETHELYEDSKGLFFITEIGLDSKYEETEEGKTPDIRDGYSIVDGKVYVTIDGNKLSYTIPVVKNVVWDATNQGFSQGIVKLNYEFTQE